jgi:hypothetical protein
MAFLWRSESSLNSATAQTSDPFDNQPKKPMKKRSFISSGALPLAVAFVTFVGANPLLAFKEASGLVTDPLTMSEFFGGGVTHHQSLDRNATGSATTANLEALTGLTVNYTWNGFTNIENRLGVANYLHFTGATAADDRSIRLTTNYNSINQSNWAGVGTTGGAMLVSGTHAFYVGAVGGSWSHADITFGRLTATGDDPAGSRNAAFTTEAAPGLAFGVQAAGFVLSNVQLNRSFTAQFFDINDNLLTSLTGTSLSGSGGSGATDGEEIFFGFNAGENPSSWISRIVITGDNAGANLGLDNLGFTAITAIPEPSTYAAIFGALALAVGVMLRRRK